MTIEGREESWFGLITGTPKRFEPGSKYILEQRENPYRVRAMEVITDDRVRMVDRVQGFSDPIQVIYFNGEELNHFHISRRLDRWSEFRIYWRPTTHQ